MTGRRSHGRLSALNGVVHQGTYLGTLLVFQASKRARLRVLRANSSVVDTSPCSEVYVPAFGKRTSVTARSAQRQVPA